MVNQKTFNIIYLVGLASYVLMNFWITTVVPISVGIIMVLQFITLLSVIFSGAYIINELTNKYIKTFPPLIFIAFVIILQIVPGVGLKVVDIITVAVFIVGARYFKSTQIVKYYSYFCVLLLTITMTLCACGLVRNLIFSANSYSRVAFGTIYPTDFCAHVFFIIIGFIFVKGNNVDIKDVISLCLFGWFTMCVSKGRNTSICFVILALLCLVFYIVNRYQNRLLRSKVIYGLGVIACIAMPLLAVLMIIMSYIYDYYALDTLLFKIDVALSTRLSMGRKAFDLYDVKPFGQDVDTNGWGGFVEENIPFLHPNLINITVAAAVLVFILLVCFLILKKKNIFITLGGASLLAVLCYLCRLGFALKYEPSNEVLTYEQRIADIKEYLEGPYFFLDCSYMDILFKSGWIMLLFVMAVFCYISYRHLRARQWVRLLVLVVVAVQCTVEHHLLDFAYNPFWLVLFAPIDNPDSVEIANSNG